MSTTQALLDALQRLLDSDPHISQFSDDDLRAAANDMDEGDATTREQAAAVLQAREAIVAANAAPQASTPVKESLTSADTRAVEQAAPVLDVADERELPPLPQPLAHSYGMSGRIKGSYYTPRQMHEYARSALSQPIAKDEPAPCCGSPAACGAACVERGRWLERRSTEGKP